MKSVRENTPRPGKRRAREEAKVESSVSNPVAPPPRSAPKLPGHDGGRPPKPPASGDQDVGRPAKPAGHDGARPPNPPPSDPAPPSLAVVEAHPEDHVPGEEAAWSYEIASAEASSDLTPVVGGNLRRLRVKRGLSLEKLSRASNVSRAMLGQIELGQSTPTINVLWKIARALGVPFSALISNRAAGRTTVMPRSRAKVLTSHDGTFSSRALFPFDEPRTVEFYELRLSPHAVEVADPHPPGTVENLVVNAGALEVLVGSERHALATGDSILFEADVAHQYRNPGETECVMYLVMTYAEKTQ